MSTALLSVLSGIAGMFGWGIYDFLGGVYSKQIGPFKTFFWSQLAGFISLLLLLIAFTINFNVPILIIILLPIAAMVYSVGYLFLGLSGIPNMKIGCKYYDLTISSLSQSDSRALIAVANFISACRL